MKAWYYAVIFLMAICTIAPCSVAFSQEENPKTMRSIAELEKRGATIYADPDSADGKAIGVYFGDTKDVGACLDIIQDCPDILYMDLSYTAVKAVDLDRPGLIARIVGVGLAGTLADASYLNVLKKYRCLQKINLSFTKVDNLSVGTLNEIRGLKVITLNGTRVDDSIFVKLKDIRGIEKFSLSETDVSGKGLILLSNPESIRFLDLSGTTTSDESGEAMNRLKNIEYLDISYTTVTEVIINKIPALDHLQFLNIAKTMVNCGKIDFNKCSSVHTVVVSKDLLDREALGALSSARNLENVLIAASADEIKILQDQLVKKTVSYFPSLRIDVNVKER